jgi:hypothetical protein
VSVTGATDRSERTAPGGHRSNPVSAWQPGVVPAWEGTDGSSSRLMSRRLWPVRGGQRRSGWAGGCRRSRSAWRLARSP